MAGHPPQPRSGSKTSVEHDFNKLSLSILDEEHHTLADTAISNILSTDIAEITYAQIVDGLPLVSVLEDAYGDAILANDHPIRKHKALCPGVLEKTKAFRAEFDPDSLRFDSRLLHAYQAASPRSVSFNTRLIEVAAVAVHQIAVLLFQLDSSVHQDDTITSWKPPKDNATWWRFNPNGPPPTLFSHNWYVDYGQYPNGVGDMVGYWAEGRILGGVVLFDRRTPDLNDVFFHADREEVTYRIYQLLDTQKQELLEFLLADGPQQRCPLPILPDDNNRIRVDPEEPISLTRVYRDDWERNPPPEYKGDERSITLYDPLNYPTKMDQYEARARYGTKFERL
ncbi:Fc.00g045890.m01.CDS01 [Cosmosporella sp. VM-42]